MVPGQLDGVTAGAAGVVLRLTAQGGWIAGQVVADRDARPVPSFVVVLSQAAGKLEERPIATPVAPGAVAKVEIAGIGAALAAQGDVIIVRQVIDGGGAAEAGIVSGDQILAVDTAAVTTMGFNAALQRIRGPVGTVVALLVRRADGHEQNIVVPRRMIQAPAPSPR
jgi:hypothetical protein